MKDLIRMNQLAGLITENQAQKMMAVLNEDQRVKYKENEYYVVASPNDNDLDFSKLSKKFEEANTTEETFYILSSKNLNYGESLSADEVIEKPEVFKIVDGRDVTSL